MPPPARRLALLVAVAAALALSPAPAHAQGAAVPGSLAVERGDLANHVSWYGRAGDRLSLTRAGRELAAAVVREPHGEVRVALEALAGDVIAVERATGAPLRIAFDGRPTVDTGPCAGARRLGGEAHGTSLGVLAYPRRPGGPGTTVRTTLARSGARYAARLSRPLSVGHEVLVRSARFLDDDDAYVSSTLSREVAPCAAAGATGAARPPAARRDRTPPSGSLRAFVGRVADLRSRRGLASVVSVSEGGATVRQRVHLRRRHGASGRVLATGRAVAARAGRLRVRLAPSRAGRRLRARRAVRVVVLTTLRDRAGNVRRLPRRVRTLRR